MNLPVPFHLPDSMTENNISIADGNKQTMMLDARDE
jgi:hypothetical protein